MKTNACKTPPINLPPDSFTRTKPFEGEDAYGGPLILDPDNCLLGDDDLCAPKRTIMTLIAWLDSRQVVVEG